MPTPETELGARVDNLAESVDNLRDAVYDEKEAREENTRVLLDKQSMSDRAMQATQQQARRTRRQGIALAVVSVVAFLVVGGLIAWLRQDANRRSEARDAALVVGCLNANESRAAIELRFEQMIIQLGSLNTPSDPAAVEARRQLIDGFVAEFRQSMPAALQPRDCSERAATQPTLVATTQPG